MADPVDEVLEKLARNVEAAVHSLYRGDLRQATAKARTGHLIREAAEALRGSAAAAAPAPTAALAGGRPSAPTVAGAVVGWSRAEGEAVMKCVTAWLPMGAPASATPESKCISSGREMVPTWGERELARSALRKVTTI
jgi:hypothetical protein